VPTGFADLDELTNGLHAGQMIIVAAGPPWESRPRTRLLPAASIHNNLTSCFFSLEMNQTEITMRLLSAEAKVPLNHIRTGQMTDDDWAKLARKMGEVSERAVLHRRLAQHDDDGDPGQGPPPQAAPRPQAHRHRLHAADELGKKVESRQLEVSEFSRNIKLLAKELEVPIIALSQLNRGPEQRADKRPMSLRPA
jgi:replicative DNA helicase